MNLWLMVALPFGAAFLLSGGVGAVGGLLLDWWDDRNAAPVEPGIAWDVPKVAPLNAFNKSASHPTIKETP